MAGQYRLESTSGLHRRIVNVPQAGSVLPRRGDSEAPCAVKLSTPVHCLSQCMCHAISVKYIVFVLDARLCPFENNQGNTDVDSTKVGVPTVRRQPSSTTIYFVLQIEHISGFKGSH